MKPRAVLNSNGTSLIQVMVAVAIMSIVALGFASMMENQNREVKAVTEKMVARELELQLSNLFQNSAYCNCVLRGRSFNTAPGSEAIVAADQITRLRSGYSTGPTDPSPCTEIATDIVPPAGTRLDPSALTVGTVGFINVQAVSPGFYRSDFQVTLLNGVRAIQPVRKSVVFAVNTSAGSVAARPFLSCGGADSTASAKQGFCTPTMSWDNSDTYVCPVMADFTSRKIQGVYTPGNARQFTCCYVPNATGSGGWCSPTVSGWGGSFTGCGAATPNYAVHRIQGVHGGQSDENNCCFIPALRPAAGLDRAFGSPGSRADSFSTGDCGGPYAFYEPIYINVFTAGVGRTVSCTYVPR